MMQNFKIELIVPFVSLSTLSYLKTDNAHSASVVTFSNLDESSEVWDSWAARVGRCGTRLNPVEEKQFLVRRPALNEKTQR